MKLIFAGSGEFGLPTLRALLEQKKHEVVLVVSQPDRPAGRGRHLTPTPIAKFAIELGLPLLRTADLNSELLPQADLMVVIAFGQKISQEKVDHPQLGSINLHGSRLPKYRGAGPVNAAIINGETISGNTIIRVAPRMDAGAILAQSSIPVGELETAGELHDRLSAEGAPLMTQLIERMEAGTATEVEQDHSLATRAPKLSREAAKIDWTAPANRIAHRIRGMYPWPGCHAHLIDEKGKQVARITLVRARAIDGTGTPGAIISEDAVAAGAGAVQIIEVQPEGKRPMPLAAFRNGHPWNAGMKLESH